MRKRRKYMSSQPHSQELAAWFTLAVILTCLLRFLFVHYNIFICDINTNCSNWFYCSILLDGLVDAVNVDCHQQEMLVTLSTLVPFHGMVYPRGLTKKSPCMAEFDVQLGDQFTYRVPLRSCNTMFIDTVCHMQC